MSVPAKQTFGALVKASEVRSSTLTCEAVDANETVNVCVCNADMNPSLPNFATRPMLLAECTQQRRTVALSDEIHPKFHSFVVMHEVVCALRDTTGAGAQCFETSVEEWGWVPEGERGEYAAMRFAFYEALVARSRGFLETGTPQPALKNFQKTRDFWKHHSPH